MKGGKKMNWKTPAIMTVMLLLATMFVAAETAASNSVGITIKAPQQTKADKIVSTKYATLFVDTKLPGLYASQERDKSYLTQVWDRAGLFWFIKNRCYTVEKVSRLTPAAYILTDTGKCIKTAETVRKEATEKYILEGLTKVKPRRGYGGSMTPTYRITEGEEVIIIQGRSFVGGGYSTPIEWFNIPFTAQHDRMTS